MIKYYVIYSLKVYNNAVKYQSSSGGLLHNLYPLAHIWPICPAVMPTFIDIVIPHQYGDILVPLEETC